MKRNLYLTLLAIVAFGTVIYLNNNPSKPFDKAAYMAKQRGSEGEKKAKEKDRPDLAAAHEIDMTKDPVLGYTPSERKIRAFEITKNLIQTKSTSKAIANVSWDERGPNNVGGRTRALFFDPNDPSGKKVWAGAVAGGIWYNDDITNPDSEWNNVDDFMANIAVSTLAYDPENPTTFYAGTGLIFTNDVRGGGIWKSEDQGQTWSHLTSTDPQSSLGFRYTQKIVVTSSSRVIAGTWGGIEISEDGGNTWSNTLEETITDIDLASDGTIYASDYSGNIYKSVDNGDTWNNILDGENNYRVELASAPSDPNTLYAVAEGSNYVQVGYFKKTTDGGSTWTDVTMPNYTNQDCSQSSADFTRGQAFFDLILGVYPDNPDHLIVGGIDLHRSLDGGATWQLISYWTGGCADYVHADQHAMVFKDSNTAIFGNDGGVYYSSSLDAETPDFVEMVNGYNTALFYSCATVNEEVSNTYLAGAQDNGMQKFSGLGINSTQEVTGGDGAFAFIDQDNSNIMISSYVYNVYSRSLDGGKSFSEFSSDQSHGRFINPADYDDNADILYAGYSADSMVVYSNISGSTVGKEPKELNIGGDRLSHIRVSPYTDNRIFVGNSLGQVYLVDNANTTPEVTRIDDNKLPVDAYVSSIEIGASDDQLLVTLSSYGVVSVWETTDGGTTWNDKEGNLPDMPIRWALYNPLNRNEVLLATEFGIWSTDNITDSSPEWAPTVEGLANVKCNMLQYRESDQQVVVATFGRGLFTTNALSNDIYTGFEANKLLTYIGSEIGFTNFTTGKNNTYLWDFGDGTTSTEANPSHSYATSGTYSVSLTVNGGQKSKTQTDYIRVMPNQDGDYSLEDGGDFETSPKDFTVDNVRGTPFERGKSAVEGKDGTASGDNSWVIGITEDQYANDTYAILYSPHFDFSQEAHYTLSFQTNYQLEEGWDGLIVEYTLDSGRNWLLLNSQIIDGWYTTSAEEYSIFGKGLPIFSGNTGGDFSLKSTDVSDFAGTDRVGFRLSFIADSYVTDVGIAIDNFQITRKIEATAAFVYTPEENNSCGDNTSITFTNSSSGDILSYTWNFGADAVPATATGEGPHEVTYGSPGTKTVTLTVDGEINGEQSTSSDLIITTNHSPKITVENGFVLRASQADSYQWLLDGKVITGATDQTYEPRAYGKYTVMTTVDGCSVLSEAHDATVLGIED
ncbi:PKD domain-containing protein, partial [Fulvivirga kasyanovii]|uniref:PKD domain-containing protein n=1 Tax=Fulvivirga kasyanovii TaxID=396812 RepID=UPI001C86ADE8